MWMQKKTNKNFFNRNKMSKGTIVFSVVLTVLSFVCAFLCSCYLNSETVLASQGQGTVTKTYYLIKILNDVLVVFFSVFGTNLILTLCVEKKSRNKAFDEFFMDEIISSQSFYEHLQKQDKEKMLNALLIGGGAIAAIIVGAVLVIAIIAILAWYISTRNDFVRLKNKVEEAWATIDVYLKKRFDLIPNLVETVKGYAKHESETLQAVVSARNIAMGAKTPDEKMAAANGLTSSLRTFFNVVQESYPELRANQNFLDLQNQLKGIENDLEAARRYYNGTVKTFNTKLELFPANIVGNRMGADYTKREYFELDSAEERQNVKVSF